MLGLAPMERDGDPGQIPILLKWMRKFGFFKSSLKVLWITKGSRLPTKWFYLKFSS